MGGRLSVELVLWLKECRDIVFCVCFFVHSFNICHTKVAVGGVIYRNDD